MIVKKKKLFYVVHASIHRTKPQLLSANVAVKTVSYSPWLAKTQRLMDMAWLWATKDCALPLLIFPSKISFARSHKQHKTRHAHAMLCINFPSTLACHDLMQICCNLLTTRERTDTTCRHASFCASLRTGGGRESSEERGTRTKINFQMWFIFLASTTVLQCTTTTFARASFRQRRACCQKTHSRTHPRPAGHGSCH